jgi:GNAT superfamily N-acetyltransferase
MPYLIRPVSRANVRQTVDIYLECLRADYSFKPQKYLDDLKPESELAECEDWLYASGSPNQIFAALDGDGWMVGYIAVGPNTGEPADHEGEVAGFFIRPQYRSLGIGLKLLQIGLEYLRGLGCRKVILYNYSLSRSNSYYRGLGGRVVLQVIQSPGGMNLQTDVFGWEIAQFLQSVNQRLAKYDAALFVTPFADQKG